MTDVFRALADPSRRHLLDQLRKTDGISLAMLCEELTMSRQAVSKHLSILEDARLIVTLMEGRSKRHYLNPVPLQEVINRWLSPFAAHQASTLIELKKVIEESNHEH